MEKVKRFPKYATEEEKQINWQKIAEVTDKDFGFTDLIEKEDEVRFAVRIILINEKNEICALKSEKYGYIELPGGGIEEGESIMQALKREAEEETGYTLKNIKTVGFTTVENRKSARSGDLMSLGVNYVFVATPEKHIGTKYTKSEKESELRPIWITPEDALITLKKQDEKLKQDVKKNADLYNACFVNRRDLLIIEYMKNYKLT